MKTAYTGPYLFMLVFILLSCVKDEVRMAVDNDDGIINTIKSSVSYTVWSSGDIIGISAYMSGTSYIYNGSSHKQYQAFGSGLFSPLTDKDKIIYPINGDDIDFIAYYPYIPGIVNDIYEIDISDQTSLKAIDFLYSNSTKENNIHSTGTELIFNHQLSKIVIDVIPGNGLTEENLNGMNIFLVGFRYSAAFNLLNGSLLPNLEIIPIKMNTVGSRSEAIVLPGSASDISISIILPGTYIYSASLPDAVFLPGTVYHYYASVNKTEIDISVANIIDWQGADNPNGTSNITERTYNLGDYYPNPYDSLTAIGVVYWLSPGSNGTSGKIISFDTSEKAWSTNNTKTVRAVSIVSGIANTNVVFAEDSTLEIFPAFKWCADKGDGWYLPGRYELHVLREQWGNSKSLINNAIAAANGEIISETDIYLTSSESKDSSDSMAESYCFSSKSWPSNDKTTLQKVRAVKMF